MNAIKKITLAALILIGPLLLAQSKKDSLGLPGDNFDLYGALELFKKAENPEAFEKAVNAKDNEVNNLDLDADGKVDYVKVVDKSEGDAHSLVLQVAVSKTETQDVAVIEIEKSGGNNAKMQIVGDEELYGKDYIIEPKETTAPASDRSGATPTNGTVDDVYNNGNTTNNGYNTADNSSGGSPVVVNVYTWPAVQYVYTPAYVGWVSPWYWGYYPGWWSPWQPMYYGVYYRRMYHYHQPYYHRVYQYHCQAAHNYYYGHRSASETVREHNRSGVYRERQASYRNDVTPGRRYNNQSANPRQQGAREQSGRENNTIRNRGNSPRVGTQQEKGKQEQTSPRQGRQQTAPGGSGTQPQQKARSQETMPGSTNQPRQQAAPGGASAQPRQQAQPKEQARPQQQSAPRQQRAQPAGRQGAMPAQRSSGGRQGGGGVGGGGNRR